MNKTHENYMYKITQMMYIWVKMCLKFVSHLLISFKMNLLLIKNVQMEKKRLDI